MPNELAPQYEAFINEHLTSGAYPTREKVLEAGLDALREQSEIPLIPIEHEHLLEEAEADLAAGRVVEWEIVRERLMRGAPLLGEEQDH